MTPYDAHIAKIKKFEESTQKSKSVEVYLVSGKDGERFEVTQGETRVIFVGEGFYPTPLYPHWESQHACIGTVTEIRLTGKITVRWDNGSTTLNLRGKDLALHQEDEPSRAWEKNPNLAFKVEKTRKIPGKTWSEHSGWKDPKHVNPTAEYVKKVQAIEATPSFDSYVMDDNIIGFHDDDF